MHKKLDKYVHHKEFSPQIVSRYSVACCYLVEWMLDLHHETTHDLVLLAADQEEGD